MSLPAGDCPTDEFYRELFEHPDDIVYATDLSGTITAINPAAERITGFSRDELLGSNLALERCAGTKFDPVVVATFRGVLAEGHTAATPVRSTR